MAKLNSKAAAVLRIPDLVGIFQKIEETAVASFLDETNANEVQSLRDALRAALKVLDERLQDTIQVYKLAPWISYIFLIALGIVFIAGLVVALSTEGGKSVVGMIASALGGGGAVTLYLYAVNHVPKSLIALRLMIAVYGPEVEVATAPRLREIARSVREKIEGIEKGGPPE